MLESEREHDKENVWLMFMYLYPQIQFHPTQSGSLEKDWHRLKLHCHLWFRVWDCCSMYLVVCNIYQVSVVCNGFLLCPWNTELLNFRLWSVILAFQSQPPLWHHLRFHFEKTIKSKKNGGNIYKLFIIFYEANNNIVYVSFCLQKFSY